ncbi:hypothetical protein Fmac_010503 [Flemingia macrophylla]|uniref:Uncharacterized protein n=1 Tax=Flemingia macrophylla TaxID=520843 RepID=A0ABD1MJS1_9FABA
MKFKDLRLPSNNKNKHHVMILTEIHILPNHIVECSPTSTFALNSTVINSI